MAVPLLTFPALSTIVSATFVIHRLDATILQLPAMTMMLALLMNVTLILVVNTTLLIVMIIMHVPLTIATPRLVVLMSSFNATIVMNAHRKPAIFSLVV
jgi:hypothetical protein